MSENKEQIKVVGFIPVEMLTEMERREVEYKRRKITHRFYKDKKKESKKEGLTFKPFAKITGGK